MHKLLRGSTTMNKCISPKPGLGNVDLNLHRGVHLSLPEKSAGRETISPQHCFELQRSPGALTHFYACSPGASHHQLNCFTHQLFPRGSYINTVTTAGAVTGSSQWPPWHLGRPLTTTGISTDDLFWLQVGIREDELLLSTHFPYSLIKFSSATCKNCISLLVP